MYSISDQNRILTDCLKQLHLPTVRERFVEEADHRTIKVFEPQGLPIGPHGAVLERPMATPECIQEKTQLSQARVNSFEKGLKRTVEFYMKHGFNK